MKKLFISLLTIAATINAFALDFSAKAQFKLTANGEACTMTVLESADAAVLDERAPMNMTNRVIALYAYASSKQYQVFGSQDLEGLALGLKTNAETNYTVNFSDVIGTLYLVDAVANKTTEITEGGSYAFTATANTTVADRFSITKVAPALPYSFINNTLVINEATGLVTVTPFTYEATGKVPGTSAKYPAPVNQVLTGGYYLVSYTNAEGVAREFIVNANPDIQLANP